MEIGTMSAEEFAKSFSEQNQNQNQNNQNQGGQQQQQSQETNQGKSSEELATEKLLNPDGQNNEGKTPEEIAAETEAAKVAAELETRKAGRPKTKLDDSFKQGLDKLFKEQKLDPYSDGTDTGYMIPETWEDVVELIDENKKIWAESSKAKDRNELYNEILSTKSPAWQFLIQNSEMYKDPAELVPLLTAVQNLEYSNSLDVSDANDQEKIVRATLSIQGLLASDIEAEVEELKESGKIEKRAAALKPILDRYNESQTDRILQEKEVENQKKEIFWNSYYQNLEDNIFKAKDIDGVKLKNEHKQLIASTLVPDEKLGGLPIYTIIDNLVAAGNFKALSKIALLSVDEKLFDTYFLTKKADAKAEGIQRVLRQSGTSANTSDFEDDANKPKPIRKSAYGYFG